MEPKMRRFEVSIFNCIGTLMKDSDIIFCDPPVTPPIHTRRNNKLACFIALFNVLQVYGSKFNIEKKYVPLKPLGKG